MSEGVTQGTWFFGDGKSQPYQFGVNPIHEYTDTGSFTATLNVRNAGTCRDTFQTNICVRQDPVIFAPNSFTPNGDGKNEEFKVVGFGLSQFEMYIYNRWGELIFESFDINKGWDGTYKDEEVQTGGYPYIIYYMNNLSVGKC